MWRQVLHYSLITILSSILNLIVLIYSNVDFFKVDLVDIENGKKSGNISKKFSYILKNNYLFFVSICIIQYFLNFISSKIFDSKSFILALFISFLSMLFIEVFPNYLIFNSDYFKSLTLNEKLVNFVYYLTKFFSFFLGWLIKEKKKFFTHGEKDLTRFINNLTSKEILLLEQSEAKLINLAFNLDDREIVTILTPFNKVISLDFSMNSKEVEDIYNKHNLTKYPVFDLVNEERKLIGIFNIKKVKFNLQKREFDIDWKQIISRKIIFLSKETKLNQALEIFRRSRIHIAIIREKNENLGIITLKDIISSLVGNIEDEIID